MGKIERFTKRDKEGKLVKDRTSKESTSLSSKKLSSASIKPEAKNPQLSKKSSPRLKITQELFEIADHKNITSLTAVMAPMTKKPESQMTSIEKMEATREGISKKALEELKNKAGFDYDQLAEVLGVARTTLINKRGGEKFPLGLSEKIMSLADLYSFGFEIFGDHREFNQWILEPLSALGGQAPYALLNNQYGREEVKNLIGRIAYGTYS